MDDPCGKGLIDLERNDCVFWFVSATGSAYTSKQLPMVNYDVTDAQRARIGILTCMHARW